MKPRVNAIIKLKSPQRERERCDGHGVCFELLQSAVDQCLSEGVSSTEIGAVLDFRQVRSKVTWRFDQFRAALETKPGEVWEIGRTRQILCASLIGSRRVCDCVEILVESIFLYYLPFCLYSEALVLSSTILRVHLFKKTAVFDLLDDGIVDQTSTLMLPILGLCGASSA